MQFSRTSSLVFSVPRVVSRLSEVVVLYPGDVIFTGTTGGVGIGRKPPSYLERGDVVVSRVEGIGTIRQVFV